MALLDHSGLAVSNYARSKEFYGKVIASLGGSLMMEFGPVAGFGRDGAPDFWISERSGNIPSVHFAFAARSREEVDAFYKAAIDAGARDNGAPGIRAHYHPNYYGAFVIDPDGHNIEAVIHTPA